MTVFYSPAGDYLEQEYLENPYLDALGVFGSMGFQVDFNILGLKDIGQQANVGITDFLTAKGQQAQFVIAADKAIGQQALLVLTIGQALGQQANVTIVDAKKTLGQQSTIHVEAQKSLGQQVEFLNILTMGMQTTISLYNTKLLRILCSFPSRGFSTATGTNAWGNPAGQGKNWKASSTASGDFSPFNLNSDITEQQWRSAPGVDVGVNLDCDTERPQGVFLDTLAILNHNLTSSADITLIGSNDSSFVSIGITIPLQARDDDENIYYVAPELPIAGYRYWRLSIDDASNPESQLAIGTIIFGAAEIFFGECFVDSVEYQLKDYADSVNTEAFTNVSNSRAQKKILRLDFRSLQYNKANFRQMRRMFREERTILKCLWIPTPDPVDQEYTARFAVFSKLAQVPAERHNVKGADADYVDFSIELDESK